MSDTHFPEKIRSLERFSERFDAYRLAAAGGDVLFATYPAGTDIEPHTHETDNWGVIVRGEMHITMDGQIHHFKTGDWYHVPAGRVHAAHCDVITEEIEFWFTSEVAASS
ncbi:MAG: cupin domain-containing protein [Cyanobacteria bacterium RM1_2_2]|nr:cupin domain-containing protein [Cyanobacteria bacterium RM1_2_2]